ncbi:MAG: hypothetical protein GX811_11660, partial [Lentisphaerae bacterium]|nr:hypothetical protein [Lentisphaerota bacterium]
MSKFRLMVISFFLMAFCAFGFTDLIIVREPCTVPTSTGKQIDLQVGTVLGVTGVRGGRFIARPLVGESPDYLLDSDKVDIIQHKATTPESAFEQSLLFFETANFEASEIMCRVASAFVPDRVLYSKFLDELIGLRATLDYSVYGRQNYLASRQTATVSYRSAEAIKNASLLEAPALQRFGEDGQTLLSEQIKKQANRDLLKAGQTERALNRQLQSSLNGFSRLAKRSYTGGRLDIALSVTRGLRTLAAIYEPAQVASPITVEQEQEALDKLREADRLYKEAIESIRAHRLVAACKLLDSASEHFKYHPYA